MPKTKACDGVSCRCCGAAYAPPHDNEWGLCETCWRNLSWRNVSGRTDENALMVYLAKRVESEAKRLIAGKLTGRCECISFFGSSRSAWGYQCGAPANFFRGDRKVCHAHVRSQDVVFVDEHAPDPYIHYRDLLVSLARMNPDFKRVYREAIEAA